MSSSKRRVILSSVSVKLGCSSCRRPKLSNIFNPKPIIRHRKSSSSSFSYQKATAANSSSYFSSSSSWDTTPTTFSSVMETPVAATAAYYSPPDTVSSWDCNIKSSRAVQGFGKIGGQSVAVEKDSDDPYVDFRQSMLQMILEKEIYSKDDLKELLNCFLQLNSPYYHGIIVRAFTEIWNGTFPAARSSSSSASPHQSLHGGWRSRGY